ncbi:ATP-binding protein [Aliisedimentitalea scapharcae]|uniref:histidine kinase n=1 Tax=Aliisedimentitalea scapharcae TaxID=1524259 RepID=A0ABZ2XNR6_9RHOB
MTDFRWHRRWIVLGFALIMAGITGAVWSYGYRQALDQLALQAEADLALASDRLSTQLQVYQELAVLMADHPGLQGLQDDVARRATAQALLVEVADKTGALDVAFANAQGRVLVAAQQVSGADVSRSIAFQRAMHGALGSEHGIFGSPGRRAYVYASPVFEPDGAVRGVVVVTADVEDVEQTWRGSLPAVFFTDDRNEVFISNRSELLFWHRPQAGGGLVPGDGEPPEFRAWRVGGHEIWQLGWGPYLPRTGLHQAVDLPVIGMVGEILVDVAPARRIAWLQAAALGAVFLAFGAMLYMTTERRRALAEVNAALEGRVHERTRALSVANEQLRREIGERREAEAALKQAQAELVQAGKLSALGQMSAGISHELNQPLMAIQQFADNGMAFMQRGKTGKAGENLGRISEMAARMARIIKNLRAFARNESEPMGKVDLVQVIATATELTEARLRSDAVTLEWTPPMGPVFAWGGDVRLVQVFVNLINNAADAMVGRADKRISVTLDTGDRLSVTVRDTGPGIADPEKIFEPFYTTRAVGSSEGMGLGLSISYGLVQSFGGKIGGVNAPGGGAVFTVELEYWSEEKAA